MLTFAGNGGLGANRSDITEISSTIHGRKEKKRGAIPRMEEEWSTLEQRLEMRARLGARERF
jgi:hypothetical protein